MRKNIFFATAMAALLATSCFLGGKQIAAYAEPDESSEEQSLVSSEEQSVESSEEQSIVSSAPYAKMRYIIKEAVFFHRDNEEAPYAKCESNKEAIGSYFLSADMWEEGEEFDIILNVKGAISTKLESKIVYIYEYRPTFVSFAGQEIKQNEDKTYVLKKPSAAGEYDLSISFTKTLVVNPVELTSLDWSTLLTVPNLMTMLSWAVIVVGFFVVFFLNRKYKKEGSTTLGKVKDSLIKYVDDNFGKEVAKIVSEQFDVVVKTSFNAISSKLDKVDNNNAVLVRCLLLMQENTPEARLAITECLSKLDVAEDQKADEVRAIIEAEMNKYRKEAEAREAALEEAKRINDALPEEEVEELHDDGPDGEDVGGNEGYGSL